MRCARCRLFVLMLGSVCVVAGAQAPPADAVTAAFASSLRACTAAGHSTPHPFVRGFTSEHRIEGERDGACRYRQTMPGDMRMECALSANGREALAVDMDAMAAGRMQGSTASPPSWAKECEIVTADGKRMPFGV